MTTHYGIWTDGETTAHLRNSVVEFTNDAAIVHLTTLDLRTIIEIVERLQASEAVGLTDVPTDPALATEPECCS